MSSCLTGIVYRIEYKLNPDVRYIGSTLQELRYRWRDHKYDYKRWNGGKDRLVSIYPYFDEYGIENFTITEIKKYQVVDRKHLRVYETLWMSKLKNINKTIPFGLPLHKHLYRENYQKNGDTIRARANQYRLDNLETIAQKKAEWRRANRIEIDERRKIARSLNLERIRAQEKAARERNIDKIKERRIKYRESNRDAILERNRAWGSAEVECKCGSKLRRDSLSKHLRTKKHLENQMAKNASN
jgi:hypothetical protein